MTSRKRKEEGRRRKEEVLRGAAIRPERWSAIISVGCWKTQASNGKARVLAECKLFVTFPGWFLDQRYRSELQYVNRPALPTLSAATERNVIHRRKRRGELEQKSTKETK